MVVAGQEIGVLERLSATRDAVLTVNFMCEVYLLLLINYSKECLRLHVQRETLLRAQQTNKNCIPGNIQREPNNRSTCRITLEVRSDSRRREVSVVGNGSMHERNLSCHKFIMIAEFAARESRKMLVRSGAMTVPNLLRRSR